MKKALLLLLLAMVSFAAETDTLRYDDRLYAINTPGFLDYLNVRPYMEFTETLQLSTTARVLSGGPATDLQEDAFVCEGSITARLTPDGIWARGRNLEQSADYYQCDPPANTRGVQGNVDITWSNSIYDTFVGEDRCTEDESCWGREGSLVLQPADYVRTGTWFRNSDSRANVVCKGTTALRAGPGLPSERIIDGSASTRTDSYTRGTYVFSGQMDIDGCLDILRHPDCPAIPGYVGREEVYSRTEAQPGTRAPEYSGTVGPLTTSIRVVSDSDLRCGAEFVGVTPSPLNVSPGGSQAVSITVRNPCPASDPLCQPFTVGTIAVSGGFRFTRPATPVVVNPGSSARITGTLFAPEYDPCVNPPTQLTFTAGGTCPGCTATPLSGSVPAYNVPFDAPCAPEIPTGELPNLVPRFNPNVPTLYVPSGEQPGLTIITWNRGMNTSNPGETCVEVGTWVPSGGFIPEWNSTASFRYAYSALAPGEEQSHGRLDFLCTPEMNQTFTVLVVADCGYTTQECANPLIMCPQEEDNLEERWIRCLPPEINITEVNETLGCALSPSTQTGTPGERHEVGIRCPGTPDGTCFGVDWDFSTDPGGNVTIVRSESGGNDLNGWVVLGEDSSPGYARISAEVPFAEGNATCSADVVVPSIPCEEFV
ncbi:MAG: hypothetical protein AB1657_01495 [Candidatus Micrarchaeota archaeon]